MTRPNSSTWDSIIGAIPGYDPHRDAGPCRFDTASASKALGFFEHCLQHVEDSFKTKAGERFILQPWQKAIVANLFGWKRPDGTRRYREALIFVPRKNGKSFLAAGIANYMLFCDGERGAQVYCGAAESEQAMLVYNMVRQQIAQEPVLDKVSEIYHRRIVIPSMNSRLRPLTAKAATKHGFGAHCVVLDELHALPDRTLYDVLKTSMGARRQPLFVNITTSDFHRESICNEIYSLGKKVQEGKTVVDPYFLPVIYEAEKDDDWKDPKIWAKANPCLGVSVSEEYVAAECKRAQDSPTYENTFKRLQLNMRTEQDVRWLKMDLWDACGLTPINEEALHGSECWGGLDLASRVDIAAFVLVFPDPDGSGFILLPRFWVPRENMRERQAKDRVPYETWAQQGLIEPTEGDAIDYDFIRKRIGELASKYSIREIAVDPWNCQQISTQLVSDGLSMVQFRQGYASMSEPTKELERLLVTGRLKHGGNPVLRWMASNMAVTMDPSGNIKPAKNKSTEKIDGIVAAIMAIGRASIKGGAAESVYASRGILEFEL